MAQQAATMTKKISQDLDVADLGRPDSLRYNILTFVINEEYDRAVDYLREFLNKESEYPNFVGRVERYVQHSIDLIQAIKAKRNFTGINSLTRTKQQELREKFKEHFQDLKLTIKKIENSVEELRINDIRSTSIVVQSLWLSAVIVFISFLILDFFMGLGNAFYISFDENVGKFMDYIYHVLNIT